MGRQRRLDDLLGEGENDVCGTSAVEHMRAVWITLRCEQVAFACGGLEVDIAFVESVFQFASTLPFKGQVRLSVHDKYEIWISTARRCSIEDVDYFDVNPRSESLIGDRAVEITVRYNYVTSREGVLDNSCVGLSPVSLE